MLAGANAGRTGEDGAAGVMDVLVEGVGAQSVLELDELGLFFMKAMKNKLPSRVPACGSMPSVKEYPRRRIRVPPLRSKLASRM